MLVEQKLITNSQLEKALDLQKGSGQRLGTILVDEGLISSEAIAQALSVQLKIDIVNLQSVEVPKEILDMFSSPILRKYKIFPFAFPANDPNGINVAMADPMDMEAMDDVMLVSNLNVIPHVTTEQNIMMAIDKHYGQSDVRSAADQYAKEREEQLIEKEDMYSEDVNNSPIVQLVKAMIEQAVRQNASDIHIEPLERQLRIRYRIDGTLYEKMTYSLKLLPAIVARIKIIGGMDISEKRKPQDGRITQVVDRREFDIRVSILPTVFGEKIVMRLTSKQGLTKSKSQLGFGKEDEKKIDRILSNPHGIILVTGPTGSGKSTTLYTTLSELNSDEVNIITVEDPVEANIDGINQVQVNKKADLTFATALRSILRQDPDIIMIGEIRDNETASIAVQASITGHLVVSTLHTNSSASTITRLEDMGVESYLLADSIVGIIAQRLVRRLCPECKKARQATIEEKIILNVSEDAECKIYEPVGCSKCDNIGYKGRIGVYEIMEVTHSLQNIIAKQQNADTIKAAAITEGMKTLRMSATEFVLEGTTSISEMKKVSFDI